MTQHDRHGRARYSSFCLLLAAVLVLAVWQQPSAAAQMQVQTTNGVARITYNGAPVLEYQTQSHPYKVYASKLYTPKGIQILRDSPHDHVHHHALMYAIGIDKIDFWAEFGPDKDGKQVARETRTHSTASGNEAQACIEQVIDWVAPNGKSLARENRVVTVYCGVVPDATLLTWTTQLCPASGAKNATLWGRHYFGLGMRFLISMDHGGKFFNAVGKAGKAVRGSEKLVRANWCAYTAQANGKTVTVAMFDDPANPRHPCTWFTMTSPFAYLSATLDLERQTLTITPSQPLHVRYGVALWDGEVDAVCVEQAYQKWLRIAHATNPARKPASASGSRSLESNP